jgi:hypothetical protein
LEGAEAVDRNGSLLLLNLRRRCILLLLLRQLVLSDGSSRITLSHLQALRTCMCCGLLENQCAGKSHNLNPRSKQDEEKIHLRTDVRSEGNGNFFTYPPNEKVERGFRALHNFNDQYFYFQL